MRRRYRNGGVYQGLSAHCTHSIDLKPHTIDLEFNPMQAHAARLARRAQLLPVFAACERWNAYVSTLNGIGACLIRLARFDEARTRRAPVRGVRGHVTAWSDRASAVASARGHRPPVGR